METVLFYADLFSLEQLHNLTNQQFNVIEISKEVYQNLAYRDTTEGVLAVVKSQPNSFENLKIETINPLILVAEAPEKPGNIGAILRTADAANVDAVIIANPKTDIYNPNIIRSSIGCVFTNKIAQGNTSEIITFLKNKNISIYSAILQESEVYYNCNFIESTAIVVGTESTGLSSQWRDESKKNIHIPMQGQIDSMNVSVATGILLFEVKKQRNFN